MAYLPAAIALAIILFAGMFAEHQSRELARVSEHNLVIRELDRLESQFAAVVQDEWRRIAARAPKTDVASNAAPASAPVLPGEFAARDVSGAPLPQAVAALLSESDLPSTGARAVNGPDGPAVLLWTDSGRGRIAALLDSGGLYSAAGLDSASLAIDVAVTAAGTDPEALVAGPSTVLGAEPVTIDVGLPGDTWQLAAVPKAGWSAPSNVWPIRLLTLLAAGLIVIPMMRTRHLIGERQRNINDLRDRESQLERLSRRLGLALDASKVGVWDFNISRDVLVWDDRMDELYGLQPDGCQRTYATWSGRLHPDDLSRAESEFRVAIEETGRYNSNYRLVLPGGDIRHIRAIGAVYSDADGTSRIVGVNWDVTADVSRNAELDAKRKEAEAASIAKSQFLATMSHEIRTPMNGVIGMLDLLLRSDLGSEQRERAGIARDSACHLLAILNDILDFSKLEANGVTLREAPVDVAALVREVISLLAPGAAPRELALTAAISPGFPPFLMCDATRLRQVLINLVGNAVKFTEAGRVEVRLSHHAAETGGMLEVAVQDTGVGIAEAAKARLFQRFAQVDSSITRQHGGTGLGLAISRQLVELMGGDIAVDSVPGLGSTFRFAIPAAACAAPRVEPAVIGASSLAQAPTRPLRILVAEDNPTNQQILAAYLAPYGHSVRMVTDGAQALGELQAVDYDLVIMDIQMPVMDGMTAARRIRALPGPLSALPIIALTANAMDGDRDRYIAAGMTDYVSKPVSAHALHRAIAGAMRGYSSSSTTAQPSPGSKLSIAAATSSVASPWSAS